MNCTHCGKKLYPEAPFCPHCGKPNEHRIELEQQVNAFDRTYEQTTSEVRSAVRRKNRFIGKIVVIAFLTLLLVAVILFGDGYASEIAYRQRDAQAQSQIGPTLEAVNAYLDEQDYFGAYAWCSRYSSFSSIGSFAPEYDLVIDNVRNYCETMIYFLKYHEALQSEAPYAENTASRIRMIRENLIYYYQDQNRSYRPAESDRTDAVEQMNRNLEMLLTAYFAVPAEEAASLSGLSEGAREVLLEKYLTPTEAP